MILYHQSPVLFDSFDKKYFGKGANSKNGRLGVWCWFKKPKPNLFGENLYTLEYEIIKPIEIEVATLFIWHTHYSFSHYDKVVEETLNKGSNFIKIIEADL